jgi:hypothetical protein
VHHQRDVPVVLNVAVVLPDAERVAPRGRVDRDAQVGVQEAREVLRVGGARTSTARRPVDEVELAEGVGGPAELEHRGLGVDDVLVRVGAGGRAGGVVHDDRLNFRGRGRW